MPQPRQIKCPVCDKRVGVSYARGGKVAVVDQHRQANQRTCPGSDRLIRPTQ